MVIKKMPNKLSSEPAKQKPDSNYYKGTESFIPVKRAAVDYQIVSFGGKAELLTANTVWGNFWVKQYSNPRRIVLPLEKVKKLFVVSNSVKVGVFLTKHPRLVNFLLEAANQIRNYFPSEELHLEVVSDPELGEDKELFAYIRTSLSVEEALEKLDEFDEMWFLDQSKTTNGIFNFNLRFV